MIDMAFGSWARHMRCAAPPQKKINCKGFPLFVEDWRGEPPDKTKCASFERRGGSLCEMLLPGKQKSLARYPELGVGKAEPRAPSPDEKLKNEARVEEVDVG